MPLYLPVSFQVEEIETLALLPLILVSSNIEVGNSTASPPALRDESTASGDFVCSFQRAPFGEDDRGERFGFAAECPVERYGGDFFGVQAMDFFITPPDLIIVVHAEKVIVSSRADGARAALGAFDHHRPQRRGSFEFEGAVRFVRLPGFELVGELPSICQSLVESERGRPTHDSSPDRATLS